MFIEHTWDQGYKTLHKHNLRMFIISKIVCPSLSFPAQSKVLGRAMSLPYSGAVALLANIILGWKALAY
jgi:hypothetical protein